MRWYQRFFHRGLAEKHLDAELRFHLEQQIADYISAGMKPEEARRRARLEFGGLDEVKEQCREVGGAHLLETLIQDLRYGLRQLRRAPGFTAVAVLTLALGIGANTAIFSLIDAVMLRPLPVLDPQHLVILKWDARHWPKTNAFYAWSGCPIKATGIKEPAPVGCSFSYPMFEQFRAENDVFTAAFAFIPIQQIGINIDGNASFASGGFVSGEFFPALGLRPALGRLLGASDDKVNAPPALVLSYSYWRRQFGSAPTVIGKSIAVNGVPLLVVGVGPRGFLGLDPGMVEDVWLPLSTQTRVTRYVPKPEDPASWWLLVGARLKPGVKTAQAQSATQVVFTRGVTNGAEPILKPEDSPHIGLISVKHGLASLRKGFGNPLFLLMAAVGLVLLIACINVASLILARTAAREKELAVRFALGAARGRIIRQLLTEDLLITAAGATSGLLLAFLGARSLAAFLSANWYAPLAINVQPDARILGFTMGIAIVTGILFSLGPALRSTSAGVAPALKEGAGSPPGTTRTGRIFGLGGLLVVGQVALSVVVLVGASLLVRTLIKLTTMNMGFDARNVIIFGVQPELGGYKDERLATLFWELQRRLRALPGVVSVGCSTIPLLSGALMTQDIYVANETERPTLVDVLNVGPNFFETMRIPLLAGRTYNTRDFERASPFKPQVVMVNRSFVRRFFAKRSPIGQRIGLDKDKPLDVEIVGVVGDSKYNSLREGIEPTIYYPMRPGGATFEVRTAVDPMTLLPSIRAAVRSVDSNLPLYNVTTQTGEIDQALFQERLVTWLTGALGLLALVVACIGLYGLLSFEVTRRTHELGVRMALGASRTDVLGLVLGCGLRLVVLGAFVGIGTAAALTRYLQALLYGVRAIDPVGYAAGTILLLIVANAACYLPARRATKVDPMVALRYE